MTEEEEVRESREAYVTEIPAYYDRFLEERDQRIAAELRELRSLVEINAQRIEELRADLVRGLAEASEERQLGFEEARQERQRIREEMVHGFEEARQERQLGFEQARQEWLRIDNKLDTHFRWMIGLLMPLVIGILVIIARSFFGLP